MSVASPICTYALSAAIPLLIHGWNLDYRLYVRGHGHASSELVLYAIPAEWITQL
jgi:hypothetical protein